MGGPHFRAGVVAVVQDQFGNVMAFERREPRGAWQLPQGGIHAGELPEDAAWRELKEETALGRKQVNLVGEYPDWTVYQWPSRTKYAGRIGQAHRWFFFQVRNDAVVPQPDGKEFVAWKWMTPTELIDQLVDFRRGPYRQVFGTR